MAKHLRATKDLLHLSVTRETAAQIGSAAAMCLHSPVLADPSYPYPLSDEDHRWLETTFSAVAALEGKSRPARSAPISAAPSSVPGLVTLRLPPAAVLPLARAATLANLTGDVPGLHARAQHSLISLGDDNNLFPRIPLGEPIGPTLLKLLFRYRAGHMSAEDKTLMPELTALVAPAVIAEYLALTDPVVVSALGDIVITLSNTSDWPRNGAGPQEMLDWVAASEMTVFDTFASELTAAS